LLAIIFCSFSNQKPSYKTKLSVQFLSYFYEDSVDVKLNGIRIFKGTVTNKKSVQFGFLPKSIFYDANFLWKKKIRLSIDFYKSKNALDRKELLKDSINKKYFDVYQLDTVLKLKKDLNVIAIRTLYNCAYYYDYDYI